MDKKGEIICGDLSIKTGGNAVLAAKKNHFLRFLKKNNLSLVLTLVGEKAVFGLKEHHGEIKKITGAYVLKGDGILEGKFRLLTNKAG